MLRKVAKLLVVWVIIMSMLVGCSKSSTQTPQPAIPTQGQPSTSAQPTIATEPQATYPGSETNPQDIYPLDSNATTTSSSQLQPPVSAPVPDKDLAAVSGLLYAFDISVVLSNKIIYLTPALMVDGKPTVSPIITNPMVENGDYAVTTDAMGKFEINNIKPGYYYLMINYPDHTVIGLSSPNTSDVLSISLEANASVPLGIVYVER